MTNPPRVVPFALQAVALTAADIALNMRAADTEANLVADIVDYHQAGGPPPRNRAERRRLARWMVRQDGKGMHR